MIKKIIIFRAAFILITLSLIPFMDCFSKEEGNLKKVLEKMAQTEKKVKSLNFNFSQSTEIEMTGEKQSIKGKASFFKPNQFRVEHFSPQKQTVVSNGKILWFYSPIRNQTFVDDWKNWAQSAGFPKGLTPFQLNVSDLKKKYAIEFQNAEIIEKRKVSKIKMIPRNQSPWPYDFFVWIDMETGIPVQTQLTTQSLVSLVKISNVEINPEFRKGAFQFDPPKNSDIYDSRLQEDKK